MILRVPHNRFQTEICQTFLQDQAVNAIPFDTLLALSVLVLLSAWPDQFLRPAPFVSFVFDLAYCLYGFPCRGGGDLHMMDCRKHARLGADLEWFFQNSIPRQSDGPLQHSRLDPP